jgi:hypothetical protein
MLQYRLLERRGSIGARSQRLFALAHFDLGGKGAIVRSAALQFSDMSAHERKIATIVRYRVSSLS